MSDRPEYPHGPPPREYPGNEHEEGFAAYGYGPSQPGHARLEDNPHAPGTPRHFAWWVGWWDGEHSWGDEAYEDDEEGGDDR